VTSCPLRDDRRLSARNRDHGRIRAQIAGLRASSKISACFTRTRVRVASGASSEIDNTKTNLASIAGVSREFACLTILRW
jgi:hypothetical protein